MSIHKNIGQIVLGIVLSLFSLSCLLPLILCIIISFTDETYLGIYGATFFPRKLSIKSWEYIGNFKGQLLTSYMVTFYVTVAGTVLGLIVMSSYAYVISRKGFFLKGFLSILIIIPMLFSGGSVSSYIIFSQLYHLKNTFAVMIFPGLINAMFIIIFKTFIISNIPDSLEESSKIDGANDWKIFWTIYFPLMKPTLASVGFMMGIGYWNAWYNAYIFISEHSKTPLQLLLIRIQKNMEFLTSQINNVGIGAEAIKAIEELPKKGTQMAILLVVSGPILVAYPFFQKYFVKGMTVGAVKG